MSALNPSKWFPFGVPTNTRASIQLFCFPYAGGSTAIFKPWVNRDRSTQVIPVELPGRGAHIAEPCIESIDTLVERLILLMRQASFGSYALYGHSLGAMIAFQLTLESQKRGLPAPRLLIVAGHRAPHQPDPCSLNSFIDKETMIQEIQHLKGTPEVVLKHPEMMQFLLPLIRSDLRLHESFVYRGETVNVPILAHAGTEDEAAAPEMMSEWKAATTADFQMERFPGDHFFIQSLGIRYFDTIANRLREVSRGDTFMSGAI